MRPACLALAMIGCLLLATNVYAGQTKDADSDNTRQETKKPEGSYVQQKSPKDVPGWAGANADIPLNDRQGLQPSYDRSDEPSFGERAR